MNIEKANTKADSDYVDPAAGAFVRGGHTRRCRCRRYGPGVQGACCDVTSNTRSTEAVRDCTFVECHQGACNPASAPNLCVSNSSGRPYLGCSSVPWPDASCPDSCSMVNCANQKPPKGLPTCEGAKCPPGRCAASAQQKCGAAAPYQCLSGSARFGCSVGACKWVLASATLC